MFDSINGKKNSVREKEKLILVCYRNVWIYQYTYGRRPHKTVQIFYVSCFSLQSSQTCQLKLTVSGDIEYPKL